MYIPASKQKEILDEFPEQPYFQVTMMDGEPMILLRVAHIDKVAQFFIEEHAMIMMIPVDIAREIILEMHKSIQSKGYDLNAARNVGQA
jgi:hypothetical protein